MCLEVVGLWDVMYSWTCGEAVYYGIRLCTYLSIGYPWSPVEQYYTIEGDGVLLFRVFPIPVHVAYALLHTCHHLCNTCQLVVYLVTKPLLGVLDILVAWNPRGIGIHKMCHQPISGSNLTRGLHIEIPRHLQI